MSGKVPTSRTINSQALSANISLSAENVGAATRENIGPVSSIADAYWNMSRGKPIVGTFGYNGSWVFFGYRYPGTSDYGCMVAACYHSANGVYYLSEVEGTVKLYTLNMTLKG